MFGRDSQVAGGNLPEAQEGNTGVIVSLTTGPFGQLFDWLRNFLLRNIIYIVPKPFDIMQVDTFVTAGATALWLDAVPNFKLPHRRAWAVLNGDAVLGNDVFISSSQPSAVGQGGRVLAQGGSLSVPGGSAMNVWLWPTAGGSPISFYQFA